jgi:uncharacterized membrane protein YeaQ/YmgE (transglycosylase-associated protein family)
MNIPILILGGLIATLYGAIFHLIRGGNPGKLLVYIILSWIGFWSGHFLAQRLGLEFLNIGTLFLGAASFASLLFLIIGSWIFLGRPTAS